MQASSMDALAEERDREVRNILTSIADLAQIMKDLSTLVIDQVRRAEILHLCSCKA